MQLTCQKCDRETTVSTQNGSATCSYCGTPLPADSKDDLPNETKSYIPGDSGEQSENQPPVESSSFIGKYRIVKRVAQGGCGIVYKARDEQLQIDVAVKVPRVDRGGHLKSLLLDEARTVARLKHPNIVRVYTTDIDEGGNVYIAMDWIEGATLRQMIEQKEATIDRAAEILEKVAAAVHEAHLAGYVHRDLKPENILINAAGEPIVTDFGLAIDESTQRNRRDEFVGTVAYMSPEQVRSESHYLDGRTDVWAIGVILYELLCGRKPFDGDQDQVLDEICNREPKPLRLLNEEIDESLAAIVEGCLRKEISERTATAGEVRDALKAWRAGAGGATAQRSSLAGRNVAVIGILVVCLLLAALAIWKLPAIISPADRTGNNSGDPPEKSNPEKRPQLPGPSERKFIAAKWNKLLDRPMEKIHWPGPESNSKIFAETELETTSLLVDGTALLKAGQTDREDYHLRITISQQGWAGGFGVFYGLKQIGDKHECERLSLNRQDEGLGKYSYRLDRDTLRLDGKYKIVETIGRSSVPIAFPGKREDLLMVFQKARLAEVRWANGDPLDRIAMDFRPVVPQVDCVGSFGLFLEDCAVTFSQFHIYFD